MANSIKLTDFYKDLKYIITENIAAYAILHD